MKIKNTFFIYMYIYNVFTILPVNVIIFGAKIARARKRFQHALLIIKLANQFPGKRKRILFKQNLTLKILSRYVLNKSISKSNYSATMFSRKYNLELSKRSIVSRSVLLKELIDYPQAFMSLFIVLCHRTV